ncbi:MAG: shikimate dehydrogenase [Eubacterium sp.]|nr:shikimate dehydrogenase [Candidatus Colimonas fimequi]
MRKSITGKTQLLTLMGYPIRHTNSPVMHNKALEYLGLPYAYLCFEVDNDNLQSAIQAMKTLKVRGGNITMPNKIAVMQYMDHISEEAEMCGAVNTVVNDDGVLTGHITDGQGYLRALEDFGADYRGKKITIVGAGGVGKTMQVALARAGAAELSVFNIHDKFWNRAEDAVDMINRRTDCKAKLYDLEDLDALKREIHDSYIVANATGMGMKPHEGKTYIPDASYFRPGMIVTDVVYSPTETEFLRIAREAGCKTMNGLSMMLFQGAASFKLWTGEDMPIEHLKEFLGIKYL